MAAIKSQQYKQVFALYGVCTKKGEKEFLAAMAQGGVSTQAQMAQVIAQKTREIASATGQSLKSVAAQAQAQAQVVAKKRAATKKRAAAKKKTAQSPKKQTAQSPKKRAAPKKKTARQLAVAKQQARLKALKNAELIALIRKASPQGTGNTLTQLRKLKKAQLVGKAKRIFHAQSIRSSKAGRSTTSSGPAAGTRSLNKTKLARATRLTRAIRAGTVTAKQQSGQALTMWKDAPGKNKHERLAAFVKKYKGVKIPAVRKARRKSISTKYAAIQGQKKPYYVASKKKSVIDRAKASDGNRLATIRAIPGKGATPFRNLSRAQQQSVVRFLSSEAGRGLRAKGAPKGISTTSVRASNIGVSKDPFWPTQSLSQQQARSRGADMFGAGVSMKSTKPQLIRAAAQATGLKQSSLKRHNKRQLLRIIERPLNYTAKTPLYEQKPWAGIFGRPAGSTNWY